MVAIYDIESDDNWGQQKSKFAFLSKKGVGQESKMLPKRGGSLKTLEGFGGGKHSNLLGK